MNYLIRYSYFTHIGKVRKTNQDNFLINGEILSPDKPNEHSSSGVLDTEHWPLVGVFDGMGGEERGETASLIAAETAKEFRIGDNAVVSLLSLCQKANRKICAFAQENGIRAMGTTAAMLAFGAKSVTLCNIGDSKVFLFADGELEQISEDHYAIGIPGAKPPLSQNLGIPEKEMMIEPYEAVGEYHDTDLYLICSDGLTDMVKTERITEILKHAPFEKIVDQLMEEAMKQGGEDNTTIIVCRVEAKKKGFLHGLFG